MVIVIFYTLLTIIVESFYMYYKKYINNLLGLVHLTNDDSYVSIFVPFYSKTKKKKMYK